jgi:hypothetical protein
MIRLQYIFLTLSAIVVQLLSTTFNARLSPHRLTFLPLIASDNFHFLIFSSLAAAFLSVHNLCFFVGRARVARWFIFEPNIPTWVNFGGP